jgi:hypothetical protein
MDNSFQCHAQVHPDEKHNEAQVYTTKEVVLESAVGSSVELSS